MGSIGLMAFAIIIWQGLPRYGVIAVLVTASIVWLLVAVAHGGCARRGCEAFRRCLKRHPTSNNKEIR
jgi:hypothetical protein